MKKNGLLFSVYILDSTSQFIKVAPDLPRFLSQLAGWGYIGGKL